MAHSTQYHHNLLVTIAAIVYLAVGTELASGIGFDIHHRLSPVVRHWAEKRGRGPGSWLPEAPPHGSLEYHSALSGHDRALFARRSLANADGRTYTFADGNATFSSWHDGYLHYAEVELGTPRSKFLVALDTGSDLFWVPCECKQCAPTGNTTYSPRQSSTSKTVPCGHALCDLPQTCAAANGSSCPYEMKYVAFNTGSSGVLVQDVLHLQSTRGKKQSVSGGEAVQAPIVFGCGQVQTGDFLKFAAGGLMGLGMGKTSVPSLLASNGLVASDSFSMCFSRDGVGRVNFGDPGNPGQSETPLFVDGNSQSSTFYNISVTAISVDDSEAMLVEFHAIVDSGFSYTYLRDPAYTLLTTNFNSRINEPRANYSSQLFEYCYTVSPGQTNVRVPEVRLMTKGGAVFPVPWPIVPVYGSTNGGPYHPIGYCLGVIKNENSNDIDTIGQNFMTGLKVVFDRSRSVLGWQKFDCYKDVKIQDSGSPNTVPWSSDTASGSPDTASGIPDVAPWSPDFAPFVPLPPLPRTPSFGFDSISSSSRSAFGGLSLILLLVLLAISMAG